MEALIILALHDLPGHSDAHLPPRLREGHLPPRPETYGNLLP